MLKISPLFSGSKGNCTLVQSDKVNILLDAGYGYRAIVNALCERGLEPKDITAIVVTHEHTDHIGALPMWTRHTATPVYAPMPICDLLRQRVYFSEVHEVTEDFDIGDVTLSTFECSHDAVFCVGYKFTSGQSVFACVTDTGCVTEDLVDFLTPCSAIMLESNHDEDMLKRGEYSVSLKRRILSPYGHLSNAQTAQVLDKLVGSHVKTVVLSHLSEKNNTRELAFNSAVRVLTAHGLVEGRDVIVYVAEQYKNGVTICID